MFAAVAEDADTAGTALKTATGWYDGNEYYVPGTNSSGFSALPSGYGFRAGEFRYAGKGAYFWSTFDNRQQDKANGMGLDDADASAYGINDEKYYGLAVRCLKD